MDTIQSATNGPFEMNGSCWDNQKKHLKENFTQLTDADLMFEPGKEGELLSRIELSLNKDCDAGHRYIVYHCG